MKSLLAVLSIFMLILSMAPCTDEIISCEDEIVHLEESNADCEGESEEDDCQAFCACSCCKVPLVSITFGIDRPSSTYKPFNLGIYDLALNTLVQEIWQPPRI